MHHTMLPCKQAARQPSVLQCNKRKTLSHRIFGIRERQYSGVGRAQSSASENSRPRHCRRSLDRVLRTRSCAQIFPITFGSQNFLQIYINEAAKLIQCSGRWGGYANRKLGMPGLPLLSSGGTSGWTLDISQHETCRHCEGTRGKTWEPLWEISRFPHGSSTRQGKSGERNPHLPTSPSHTPSRVFSWRSGSELILQILPICILDLYIFVYSRAQT